MERLCDDLLRDIFSRLPGKDVGRLRCTTKYWTSIASDPFFLAMQAQRSIYHALGIFHVTTFGMGGHIMYFPIVDGHDQQENHLDDYMAKNAVTILASRNGLLLCCSYVPNRFPLARHWVYNPTTKQSRVLPRVKTPPAAFALAVEPTKAIETGQYTVVCLAHRQHNVYGFHVYQGRRNRWRETAATLECVASDVMLSSGEVFVDGAVHWLRARGDIVVFEVGPERARLMELPEEMRGVEAGRVWFGMIDDQLSLARLADGEIVLYEYLDHVVLKMWEVKRRIMTAAVCRRGVVPIFFDRDRMVVGCRSRRRGTYFKVLDNNLEKKRDGALDEWNDGYRKFTPYISNLIQV